jgi:hypothetical protein
MKIIIAKYDDECEATNGFPLKGIMEVKYNIPRVYVSVVV